MNTKLSEIRSEFLKKQQILEAAKQSLKKEFMGLDDIIDRIIINLSSWYNLSEIQEKPLIINLWGLTGVGKTSLVVRLAELIGFEDKFYKFDLGEKEGKFSFRDSLEDLCDNSDSSPIIIALDEFQHSRTIEAGPYRKEIDQDQNRMIWELIDSGKVQYIDWKGGLWWFEDLIHQLKHLIQAGLIVKNGIVLSKKELYISEMNDDTDLESHEKILFFPEDKYDRILDFAGERMGLYLQKDVKNALLQLNGEETIDFLWKVLKIAKRPTVKNFTKSLIFILGNIDEAYSMSGNQSADMDADEFHKQSLKITVPDIKRALQTRFRYEQIARLGNIHIIYPALSNQTYHDIIQMELNKYSKSLLQLTGLKIEFDKTIENIIFREGVYPAQGVRPIFTSIHYLLKSKMSLFISEILQMDLNASRLYFYQKDKTIACKYYSQTSIVHCKKIKIDTPLEDLRTCQKDDNQAITSVHESGHAIISAILLHVLPEIVHSVTTDSENKGFIITKFPWDYISRKEILPRAALFLGGYVAEEIVFGKENLTAGASSDIEKAMAFLSEMYKNSGMGSSYPISYAIPVDKESTDYHQYFEIENEMKQTMEAAYLLARNTLESESVLLLKMSDYLSNNRMMKKFEIKSMIEKYADKKPEFIEDGNLMFYRNRLKTKVQEESQQATVNHFSSISLNNDGIN